MEIKKVIRSKRKTISFQVTDDATLIVREPFAVSEVIVNRVILKIVTGLRRRKKRYSQGI